MYSVSHFNYCIHVSANVYHAPVDPLYFDLKIIKYEDLLHIRNATFIYSVYHHLLPASLIDTLAIDFSHVYSTRASSRKLINSYAKTNYIFLNSIKNQCILSWNHCHMKILPSNILLHDLTVSKLKSTLKTFFLNSYLH